MNIRMKNLERLTLDEMEQFVNTSQNVVFEGGDWQARYTFVEGVLNTQGYRKL